MHMSHNRNSPETKSHSNVNSAGMLNWAGFWRQLSGNFHTDLAALPQLE